MSNRLAAETSPYLLQHKDNPVDWYPWGEEALARARSEAKPIMLSIGYAACHWCHVMERESFEDPETAALMNEHFVNIKVDREERPDLDAVYMEAVQAMTGQGGWPMTVFLTPEGVPFFGGTYFPPEDRYGIPSFRRLLTAVARTWYERPTEVEAQGRKLIEHMGAFSDLSAADEAPTRKVLDDALEGLRSTFDAVHGGFGSAPKFPQPMTIDLLHRFAVRGHAEAGRMAERTLDAMASGGMYDQLRGGFHRYSVDREWVVPHFEKMLYDNAQLIRTYARSWQLNRSERHRHIVAETVNWMLDEMLDPAGGFWSTIDADSQGSEGRFYVWSLQEVREVAGRDADSAIDHWGMTDYGNFEGANIPIFTGPPRDAEAVERARGALLARRAERVRPATDNKVLTAWNGLAASCLAEAGVIFARRDWIEVAERAMRFVLTELRRDGRLMRSYRDGVVKHLAFAEDYALTLEACLALFEATGGSTWLEEARWSAEECIRLFLDRERGGFYTTGSDAEQLITRAKDLVDNALPAANSVLALELQRLSLITGDDRYASHAVTILKMLESSMERSPLGFGHLLGALDLYTGDPLEIVVVHAGGAPDDLLGVIHERALPNKVLVSAREDDDRIRELTPLLEGRTTRSGETTVYVCRNRTCDAPVTSPAELDDQLARWTA